MYVPKEWDAAGILGTKVAANVLLNMCSDLHSITNSGRRLDI